MNRPRPVLLHAISVPDCNIPTTRRPTCIATRPITDTVRFADLRLGPAARAALGSHRSWAVHEPPLRLVDDPRVGTGLRVYAISSGMIYGRAQTPREMRTMIS